MISIGLLVALLVAARVGRGVPERAIASEMPKADTEKILQYKPYSAFATETRLAPHELLIVAELRKRELS